MKLEPGRSSLAGSLAGVFEARSAQRPPVVQPKAIPPRCCVTCRAPDQAHVVEGEYDAAGNQVVEHSITIDLRYLKRREDFGVRYEAKGWRFRIHQGRPAMERWICRPCLNEQTMMRKEWERKRANDPGVKRANDEYYLNLCGDN